MIVVLHVLTALISLVFTFFLYIYPTRTKLFTAYGLTSLTLASGSYLAWSTKAQLVQACVSGLVYLGIISTLIILAQRKLAKASN